MTRAGDGFATSPATAIASACVTKVAVLAATLATILAATLAPDRARAQSADARAGERPRIALALSGGGARGAAHIGVLKVLEDLRVPVDCIAGTSMGSIVGGAYAAGTSVARMERLVTSTNWRDVFYDTPPRAEVSVRRKAEDYRGFVDGEFGVDRNGLHLPKGLIAGVSIESIFRRLTDAVEEVEDFSRLPIPFRAVATDIVTGEAVVLDHGPLARAMRASMAIPGGVTPVEIDGRMLVDGGVSNNLPIDVARAACGADVVIAVNIQTPLLKREDITSAIGVLGQLVNLLGKVTVDKQLATLTTRDVLISPDLGDVSAASFERAPQAIEIGEAAARAMRDSLARYSVPETQFAQWRAKQAAARVGLGAVDRIEFAGVQRTNAQVLEQTVLTRPGRPLTEDALARDLRRLYGRGDFDAVDYRIVAGGGERTLLFTVRERDLGSDRLRMGLGLATDFRGEAGFNVRASYRRSWLNRFGAEWLVDAQVGRRNALLTEFYQPLDPAGRVFVAPYALFEEARRSVYVGDVRAAELRASEARLGLDAGFVLGTVAEFRIGAMVRQVASDTVVGLVQLPSHSERAQGLRARAFVDQLDRPYFARHGYALNATLFAGHRTGGASEGAYRRLDARADGAWSAGPHSLNVSLQGGGRLGSELPLFDAFSLGGPFALSGYPVGRFLGEGFVYGRVQYHHRFMQLPNPLGTGVYAGAALEAGSVGHQLVGGGSTGPMGSGALFIGADTFLGPVYLIAGLGSSGNRAVYLFIGLP